MCSNYLQIKLLGVGASRLDYIHVYITRSGTYTYTCMYVIMYVEYARDQWYIYM